MEPPLSATPATRRLARARCAARVLVAAAAAAAAIASPASSALDHARADGVDGAILLAVGRGDSTNASTPAWVELVRLDGSAPRRLTLPRTGRKDALPTWSPDGRSIAFVRRTSSEHALYTVPAVGGRPRRLASLPADLEAWWPVWSPDGSHVALALNPPWRASSPAARILVVSRRGRTVSFPPLRRPRTETWVSGLAWSADGRRLAYLVSACCGSWTHLHVAGRDGAGRRAIRPGRFGAPVRWSPDGRHVLFVQCAPPRGTCSVLQTTPSGRSARVLAAGLRWREGEGFDLAPAGDEIVVAQTLVGRSGARHVLRGVRRADGRMRLIVADAEDQVSLEGFSADGTTVVHGVHLYGGGRETGIGFRLTRLDGSASTQRRVAYAGDPRTWLQEWRPRIGSGLGPPPPEDG